MATTPTNNFDFQNYYSAQLTADITSGSLTISLDTVPTPVEGILVIEPDSTTNREIIFYNAKGVNTITCPSDGRGWDGTTANSHLTGSTVIMAPVAYMLRMLKSGSLFDTTRTGWTTVGQTLTYSANNGNREFVLNTPVDLTGTLSVGNRLKFDRVTAPATQSMAFASASSQYATKASPAGFSTGATVTCEAWVYLNSYNGGVMPIFTYGSGTNATNGFKFCLNGSGQLTLSAYASSGNQRDLVSSQSVPLKRFVHVAASMDLSAGTGTLYINAGAVTSTLTTTGTATSYASATQIYLAHSVTAEYFDGYMSEVRVWNTVRSQANIQANQFINLTGSETGLIGLWRGDGDFTDKTTNANTLTATNGAIATQATNPYHTTEFGIVTALSTSQLTLFTAVGYGVPNGSLTNFYYSTARAPYGFPTGVDKWQIQVIGKTNATKSSGLAASTWYNTSGLSVAIPTGTWRLNYQESFAMETSPAGDLFAYTTLSTSSSAESDKNLTAFIGTNGTKAYLPVTRVVPPISLAAATTYYLLEGTYSTGTWTVLGTRGDLSPTIITAECAYL